MSTLMEYGAASQPDDMTFRDQLVEYRRVNGLTQADLALRLGTTSTTVGRWERGQTPQQRWRQRFAELRAAESADVIPFPEIRASLGAHAPADHGDVDPDVVRSLAKRFESGVPVRPDEIQMMQVLLGAARQQVKDSDGV